MNPRQLLKTAIALSTIVVLALALCGWAQAQVTYKTLYKFKGIPDGNGPFARLIADSSGNLYGTTLWGGTGPCKAGYTQIGCGTVFELSPGSGGKWTETVLYSFSGGTDGGNPHAGVTFDSNGNLYGVAEVGGLYNEGVVFQLTPANGGWTETVLHNFTGGADGAFPTTANLIFDSSGNLYGTTWNGGNTNYCGTGCGVVFELSPGANNNWTETVLYTFQGPPDLENSASTLIFDNAGNLYGTTWYGGNDGNGGVYELVHGSGGWTEKVLYKFKGGANGASPAAGVIFDSAGNLYGITGNWMSSTAVVYDLVPESGGGWAEHSLHRWPTCSGCIYASDALIFDQAGNIYGASIYGGPFGKNVGHGYGFIFEMTPNGSGGWNFQMLHAFDDKPGEYPAGGLLFDGAGNIYGTTSGDQQSNFGTVFEITR